MDAQGIELFCRFASGLGSRSAPIGTCDEFKTMANKFALAKAPALLTRGQCPKARDGAASKIPSRRGTEGSNPSLSGGESANPRSRSVVALIPPDLARSSSSLDAARYDAKLDFK